jgi:hypothetical protein
MTNELTVATRLAEFEQRTILHHQHETFSVWKPSEGDSLFGVILSVEPVTHPSFGQQFQLSVKDKAGKCVRVWLSRYLRQGLIMQNAQPNDLVAISYHGMRKNSRGLEYGVYQLTVEKEVVHGG